MIILFFFSGKTFTSRKIQNQIKRTGKTKTTCKRIQSYTNSHNNRKTEVSNTKEKNS